MTTIVAEPTVRRGSCDGVRLVPRVTISRTCTPSHMAFASSVRRRTSIKRFASEPMSRSIAFAPSYKPVQVRVEEQEDAVLQADPLPDAVADEEAAVEHRDGGLGAGLEFAVDVDQDRLVARVVDRVVCPLVGAAVGVTAFTSGV
jgi:hypothetical protein